MFSSDRHWKRNPDSKQQKPTRREAKNAFSLTQTYEWNVARKNNVKVMLKTQQNLKNNAKRHIKSKSNCLKSKRNTHLGRSEQNPPPQIEHTRSSSLTRSNVSSRTADSNENERMAEWTWGEGRFSRQNDKMIEKRNTDLAQIAPTVSYQFGRGFRSCSPIPSWARYAAFACFRPKDFPLFLASFEYTAS